MTRLLCPDCDRDALGAAMTETDGRWRHTSGDDRDGCGACQREAVEALLNGDEPLPGCFDPGDDGDGFCPVCGHHTERAA